MRGRAHRLDIGEDRHDQRAAGEIDEREECCDDPGPDGRDPYGLAHRRPVAGADGATDERFGRMGETVEPVADEGLEDQQHGVRRQHRIAELGALRGEPGEGGEQAERADEDVEVDPHHADDALARADERPAPGPADMLQAGADEGKR